MSGSREELVFMAKTAERCNRYEDMTEYMSRVVEAPGRLNDEERSLLATAFKNAISKPRNAWKIVKNAARDEGMSAEVQEEVQNYMKHIEDKVRECAQRIICLLRDYIIPGAVDAEEIVFYEKMHGDYHRYLSEVVGPDEKEEVKAAAKSAYKAGEEAGKLLPKNSATKHSLALNLAVFYHESCDDQAEAINVTTAALAELSSEELMHEDVTEVTEIKKLLEENLKLWTDPNKMLQYDGTAVEDC